MIDTKPTYNLKVIVRETGIKPDTLRAWERRYRLPMPERTTGGHRLYSQRDLETIRWLVARQKEGHSISRAVEQWRDMEANGEDPLQPLSGPPSIATSPVADLAVLRETWLRACLAFDETAAEQQLAHALTRYAPELVCLEILQKGLAQIGWLWYENRATVQQEHFALAMALRRVNILLAAAPPPSRLQLVLLACPPQEEHSFPLLLLALLLRYRGWPIAYLGANVPLVQMETALTATRPALVVLAAQTLPAAAEALTMARFFQAHGARLAYGGYVFNNRPELRPRMPGYYLGETLTAAAATVAEILTVGPPMPPGLPTPATHYQALAEFNRQCWIIEGRVWRILQREGWSEDQLQVANLNLAQHMRAALVIGDMNLIDQELHWLKQLLVYHQVPEPFLARYLVIYAQEARNLLDESSRPIIEWLDRAVAEKIKD
jgi:DNA-binding transcriptional MerR regulator